MLVREQKHKITSYVKRNNFVQILEHELKKLL